MPPESSVVRPVTEAAPAAAVTLSITLTPDDADAIYRTLLGHHVRALEVHKTRVLAERLRQFVVERLNDPIPFEVTFNHTSAILSADEVARFLDEGESYRSISSHSRIA